MNPPVKIVLLTSKILLGMLGKPKGRTLAESKLKLASLLPLLFSFTKPLPKS